MAKNYYLLSSGRLVRRENTVYFEGADGRKPIPINDIYSIYALGEISLNSKLLNFLARNKIPVHFFNYYGFYTGSFYPREHLLSGFLVVRQAEHYLDRGRRLSIAKELVTSAGHNMLANLDYYQKRGKELSSAIGSSELPTAESPWASCFRDQTRSPHTRSAGFLQRNLFRKARPEGGLRRSWSPQA